MVSGVKISRSLADRLRAEAAASPDAEICGLLFGSAAAIAAAEPCRNTADDPWRRFEIDPAALFAALKAERAGGAELIGYYHSHPAGDPTPSATDAAMAAADGKLWLIVTATALRAWLAGEGGAVHGRFDEITLAVD